MTRPCSGCGRPSCDGRCFNECPADYAEPEEGDTGITLDQLIKQFRDADPLVGDPFEKRRDAA